MPSQVVDLNVSLPTTFGHRRSPAVRLRGMKCGQCGYGLSGLAPEGVCPECGLPISEQIRHMSLNAQRWTHTKRVAVGIGLGALATVPAMFLSLLSGGLGHGHYTFARACYPYSMLLTRITDDYIGFPSVLLALLQLPLYGLVFACLGRQNPKRLAIIGLFAVSHLVAAIACFSGVIPNFS